MMCLSIKGARLGSDCILGLLEDPTYLLVDISWRDFSFEVQEEINLVDRLGALMECCRRDELYRGVLVEAAGWFKPRIMLSHLYL